MFENDDWDLDQDFLNDVDDKTSQYYSQKDDQEKQVKRRKIESSEDPILSLNYDVDFLEEKNASKTFEKCNENKESRKNLILGIFNKNLPDKSVSQNASNDPERSYDNTLSNTHANHMQSCENNQLNRKNLVLGILKNKNAQDRAIKTTRNNIEPKKTEVEIKSNCDIDMKQHSIRNNDKTKSNVSKNYAEAGCSWYSDNFEPHSSEKENWKGQLFCDVSKQQSKDNINTKTVILSSKNNIPVVKPAQAQSNKKMTLVRKFPGPAGLLPDDIDSNIACVSYLNSLEESEGANEEQDSSNLSEYCSQNTKNLFTEGAWQLMLEDLPHNFLKGHNIAAVKQMANLNGLNSTKVEFLAGIIESIDYSHDNPPIALKDFTDNIRGIVHKDIPLKYPGLLESNVVVLLHDIGLLRISDTVVSNKYQILIFPSSLLAIYTSKGTIERTQYMQSVLQNISSGSAKAKDVKEKENHMPEAMLKVQSSKTNFSVKSNSNSKRTSPKKKAENTNEKGLDISKSLSTVSENLNEPMDLDSNISFSVSPSRITDSQNQMNFNTPLPANLKHMKHSNRKANLEQSPVFEKDNTDADKDDKERARNLLKSLKRFVPDKNEKKYLSHNPKNLLENAKHSTPINTCSKELDTDILKDMFFEKMDVDECNVNTSLEKNIFASRDKKTENNIGKSVSCIRSKLLQFKSADVLIPLGNSAVDSEKRNEKFPKKKSPTSLESKRDALIDAENDSDDEMLSQLDMDTIFSNYNDKS